MIARLGMMAMGAVARAIARGVYAAETLGDAVAYRDRARSGDRGEGGGT